MYHLQNILFHRPSDSTPTYTIPVTQNPHLKKNFDGQFTLTTFPTWTSLVENWYFAIAPSHQQKE